MSSQLKLVMIHFLLLFILIACVEKEEAIGEKKTKKIQRISTTSIGKILNEKNSYKDKEVEVTGKVKPGLAFEFENEQPYLLKDGLDEIWVITKGLMPKEDINLTVSGKVVFPYQIKGRQYEVVIIEIERGK